MELTQKTVGSVIVVKPSESRLDARSAPAFKELLGRVIAGGNTQVVLDLSEVTFVDSSGLGAIASAFKALEDGRGLVICGARDAVRSMFKLTRLDKVVRVVGTEDQAVAAFAQ